MIFFVFFYMILKKPTITAASDDPRLLNVNSAEDFISKIRSEDTISYINYSIWNCKHMTTIAFCNIIIE